jgi:sortase B
MQTDNQQPNDAGEETPAFRKPKKKRIGKTVYMIAIILLSGIMCFSLYKVISISAQYEAGEAEYEGIAEEFVQAYETYAIPLKQRPVITEPPFDPLDTLSGEDSTDVSLPNDQTAPLTTVPPNISEPLKESVIVVPKINVDYLKSKNSEFRGWIYLDGTQINYPVAQGSDNDYYLDHTFYGQNNINGCIFLDYRHDLNADNKNLLIYGHHMKSGAMFAILRMYVWYDFYYSHKYITYVTEDGPYLITVFSAYNVSEVSDAWKIDFTNDEEYAAWLKKVKAASQVPTDLTPTVDDRVVTLTTCSFVFDNARMVVHGVIEPLF